MGKEPVVVIKERGVNTTKAGKNTEEANDTKSTKVSKKRKSRKEAKADRELIKNSKKMRRLQWTHRSPAD